MRLLKQGKNMSATKGNKIKYTGEDTSVLVHGETYEVASSMPGGIQVVIPTGFCGITEDKYELVK